MLDVYVIADLSLVTLVTQLPVLFPCIELSSILLKKCMLWS